jgi:guanylate kinase
MNAPPASQIISRRGFLLVLSSPSGAGKTTITRQLIARDPTLSLSVSVTTRKPRPSEVDGRDYYFIDQAKFDEMVTTGDLLEHATVFGHSYGTPRKPIEQALNEGRDVVTDIDWQGTQQLRETVRGDVVTVFVLPPSISALDMRLRTRAEDTEQEIVKRMSKSSDEMSHWAEYDFVVVNDDLAQCVATVESILTVERLRRTRSVGLADFVNRVRSDIAQRSAELLKSAGQGAELDDR